MLTVVMLGPPGAGKGTQAAMLAQREGLLHLSTGEMLRQAIASGSELGLRVKAVVESGQLVPDDVVASVVSERLARTDAKGGVLLDGFPRTARQADLLDGILTRLGMPAPTAVDLQVPDEDLVARLSARRECATCGPRPPGDAATCSACGGNLARRADDAPDVVRERLRVYRERTAPLSEHYRQKGVLQVVDGRGAPGEVAARVSAAARARPAKGGA